MTLEDYAAEFCTEVWPDNAEAVGVFIDLGTQWRVGPRGPYGVDYNVIPMICDLHEIAPSNRNEILQSIRIMESAALSEMRSNG